MRGGASCSRGRLAAALGLWLAAPSVSASVSPATPLRILHFGDSHVAGPPGAAPLKELLGAELPDGGPGLLTFGTLPAAGTVSGVRVRISSGWRRERWRKGELGEAAGLDGGWAEAAGSGERVSLAGSFSSILLFALRQAEGGEVLLSVDGRPDRTVSLAGPIEVVPLEVRSAERSGVHLFTAETRGPGRVRLLGAYVATGTPGFVYSPVGVVGASAALLLASEETLFLRQVALISPSLVLVSFGTNEAREKRFEPTEYRELLAKGLARIRAALPGVPVLVVGPPEQERRDPSGAFRDVPQRAVVSRCQAEVSARLGLPFLDLAEAMEESGGLRAWLRESQKLVQPDHVHFTRAGYERLASLVATKVAPWTVEPRRSSSARAGVSRRLKKSALSAELAAGSDVRAFRDPRGNLVLTNVPGAMSHGPVLGRAAER